MRRETFRTVVFPAALYFPTLSHKRHDSKEKNIVNTNVCLIFSTTLHEIFINLRITQEDGITKVHWSSWAVAVILVRF
jgi:hypothetical protein